MNRSLSLVPLLHSDSHSEVFSRLDIGTTAFDWLARLLAHWNAILYCSLKGRVFLLDDQ